MELNENARIDTSQIDDQRSSGGGGGGIGGLPIGGGGLTGMIVTVLVALVGGFLGINNLTGDDGGAAQTGVNTSLTQKPAAFLAMPFSTISAVDRQRRSSRA